MYSIIEINKLDRKSIEERRECHEVAELRGFRKLKVYKPKIIKTSKELGGRTLS
jgi:hypothetical protein